MKILNIILVTLLFEKCQSVEKVENNMFLNLNAIFNTITYDKASVIYSNWDTAICIYSVEKKSLQFEEKIKDICYAKPILKNGKIYFPFSNDRFVCKELSSGKLLWEINLKGRCSNFDFLDDTTIIASTKHHGLIIVNSEQGKLLYELKYNYEETQLPDLSPWLISYDSQNYFVSNWQGHTLSSFNKKDGIINWQFTNKDLGNAGQSVVSGDKIFVGINEAYKSGKLIVLDKSNGSVLHQQEYKYEDREMPIFYSDTIYFYSYDRFINSFSLITNKATRLKSFENNFDLSGNQMFLVSNKIYFSDASFFLNSYSINDNTFIQIESTKKSVIGVYNYKGINYFMN